MDEYTVKEVIAMDDGDIIELAYDAWLNDDDCGRWTLHDITDEGPEDDSYDTAKRELGWWFDGWMCDLPDPLEEYADGFSPGEIERIERLMEDFAYAAIDGIEQQEDYYQTLMSLPR